MPSRIETLFPTFVYRAQLPAVASLNRELAREIAILETIDAHGARWSSEHYHGGYTSYSSMDKLHLTSPNFAELERRLKPYVGRMVSKLKWDLRAFGKIRMTTCWANAMGVGSYHTMHAHPQSILSGVYYVEVPKHSSPLKIEDPRAGLMMAAPPRRATAPAREQNYVIYPAKAGQLIMFESWLRHEVPPHRASKRRLSVSFNW